MSACVHGSFTNGICPMCNPFGPMAEYRIGTSEASATASRRVAREAPVTPDTYAMKNIPEFTEPTFWLEQRGDWHIRFRRYGRSLTLFVTSEQEVARQRMELLNEMFDEARQQPPEERSHEQRL